MPGTKGFADPPEAPGLDDNPRENAQENDGVAGPGSDGPPSPSGESSGVSLSVLRDDCDPDPAAQERSELLSVAWGIARVERQ